jgi:hypothetical protein
MIIGCYIRLSLQVEYKKYVNVSKKYSFFFCPAGDIILVVVEKHHPFTPRPVRDKMFSSSHDVPDGTLATGGILLSTNMLSLTGRNELRIIYFYNYTS